MPPKAKPGELRIIAGQWRGRKFPVIDEPGLRPTPDRVRETVFNWLQNKIVGAHCLDLFAGSGALGLEALSRGAAHVTFVDNNGQAIKQIEQTLTRFGANNATLLHTDALQSLNTPPQPYDIIFLDPPFNLNYLPQLFNLLTAPGWLSPQTIIYLETEVNLKNVSLPSTWQITHEKTAGQVCYRLIKVSKKLNLIELIEQEYSKYKEYLDHDFLLKCRKNATQISSRYTEILLAKLLLNNVNEWRLTSPYNIRDKATPDFCLSKGSQRIFIECITPQNDLQLEANRLDKLCDRQNLINTTNSSEKFQIILSGAVKTKAEKYSSYLKSRTIRNDDSFIIAIGLYGLDPEYAISLFHFRHEHLPYHILGAFFPVGYPTLRHFDDDILLPESLINKKANGALIEKNIFENNDYKCVSAIVITGTNWDMSDKNDLLLIHNPEANNKIQHGILKVEGEYTYDIETKQFKAIV